MLEKWARLISLVLDAVALNWYHKHRSQLNRSVFCCSPLLTSKYIVGVAVFGRDCACHAPVCIGEDIGTVVSVFMRGIGSNSNSSVFYLDRYNCHTCRAIASSAYAFFECWLARYARYERLKIKLFDDNRIQRRCICELWSEHPPVNFNNCVQINTRKLYMNIWFI